MKKILSGLMMIILTMAFLMPLFSSTKNYVSAESEPTFEESITQNKQQIVSTNKSDLSGQLLAHSVQGGAPFDSTTKEFKPGYIIEPTINSYGEVDSTFAIPSFSTTESKSVYIWVFIPDEYPYDLTIKFSSASKGYIEWNLNSFRLAEMFSEAQSTQTFGWKLFELCVSDATKNLISAELDEVVFNEFSVSYLDSLELGVKYSNNRFAFYDVYVADTYSQFTSIISAPKYVNFEFNSDFFYRFQNLYIGDTLLIPNVVEMFSYIYAGKQNLKLYHSNEYVFKVTLTRTGAESEEVEYNTEYTFAKKGFYTINIMLYEKRVEDDNTLIFNHSLSTFCDEFTLGGFSLVNFSLEYGQRKAIYFTISEDFVAISDFVVKSSNSNIVEIESFEVADGKCHIVLHGKKDGDVKITISANGHREGEIENILFSKSTKVSVKEKNNFGLYLTIVWITFGVYFVVIVTFIVISFVKARKFGVR